MEENKSIWQKVVSFGMETCIKSYKEKKHARISAMRIIQRGASIFIIRDYVNRENIDLFNLNRVKFLIGFLVFTILAYTLGFLWHPNPINKFVSVVIIIISPIILANWFTQQQCKYLINEFSKIDEIDDLEDIKIKENNQRVLQEQEQLKQKIAACNLYMK